MLAILLALCAALSNAVATVLQRRAALTVPASTGLRPGLLLDLLRRRVWLAGILAVIAAAVFQAAALAGGKLSLVQPLFVLELPFALMVGSLVLRRGLPPRGWAAIGCVVLGLGIALGAAAPSAGEPRVEVARWIPALAACGGLMVLLCLVAVRRPIGRVRAWCLGAAAAVGYALTAALMKSATRTLADHGLAAFFTAWQTYAFAAVGVAALFLLENALQGGPLVASQPALTLGDAAVSLTLGVLLYREQLRTGWWLLPELLGIALVAAGAIALARTPLTRTLVGSGEPASRPDPTLT
ncbi:DMT family transporter [Kitasatospora sp. NPDC059571]|uniref:DMT family transporter n=1 Tax=Kitasatospora sp. NPDC059571 TaxID=3346871 RepID=UPI0036C732B2